MKKEVYSVIMADLEEHKRLLIMELRDSTVLLSQHLDTHMKKKLGHSIGQKKSCLYCRKIFNCQKIINLTINELKEVKVRVQNLHQIIYGEEL